MEYLRNIFKNKDRPVKLNLILMAVAGIVLLVLSRNFLGGSSQPENMPHNNEILPFHIQETRGSSLEEELERRLIAVLSQVAGVGEVDVMISMSHSAEIILAEDIRLEEHTTKEVDSEGGTREITTRNQNNQAIILQNASGQQPLVLKEIEPRVEGVIIVAQGGDDIFVIEAITNAARTVLGVAPHRVVVLKMK
ncbi:MAG: hypothetical protein FWD82_04990 [Defluviitaleaceae bacterium]|nr:hypothetical protein [Defluviitaleaceae bacterium]